MAPLKDDPNILVLEIGDGAYAVPDNIDTTYHDYCVDLEAEILKVDQNYAGLALAPMHIVGFEFLQGADSGDHLHHLVVYGVESGQYVETYSSVGCNGDMSCNSGNKCSNGGPIDTLWPWAPGFDHFVTPHVAGFLVGSNGYVALEVNVHFDNPAKAAGIIDNSKIRIYLSRTLRQHSIGVLSLGDGSVSLAYKPVKTGDGDFSSWTFECGVSMRRSTQNLLGGNSIDQGQAYPMGTTIGEGAHVFSRSFHMHAAGEVMYTTISKPAPSHGDGCLFLKRHMLNSNFTISVDDCTETFADDPQGISCYNHYPVPMETLAQVR